MNAKNADFARSRGSGGRARVVTLHQVSRISWIGATSRHLHPRRRPCRVTCAQLGAEDTWERGGKKAKWPPVTPPPRY